MYIKARPPPAQLALGVITQLLLTTHLLQPVGERDFLHLALDEGDNVVQLVGLDDFARLVDDAAAVHADDLHSRRGNSGKT